MAIKFNRSQTFATGGTVTSAALHNLIDGTDIYPALITDQSNLSTISTADKLLIADTDDTINAKSTTVQNLFDQAFSGGTYTALNLSGALTYGTATGNRTVSTNASITTGTINNATLGTTTGTAATFTSSTLGTTTSTAANITNGTIQTLTSSTATITGGTFSGSINSTTGTINNFSTTLAGDLTISQGTATLGTSGVTAGTYGGSSSIPTITVDTKGRVTTASTSALTTGYTGFRNRVYNGAFRLDQRGAGAAQTFTAGAALAYCVDRFYGYCTGANVTGQQVSVSAPNEFAYRFTGAASVTGIGFGTRLEATNTRDLAGSTATLSVELANSLLTTVTWTMFYANSADAFGTLASPTRTQIATGTFTVNSTLTRYSTQVSIPSAATTGLEIVFTVGAQTSGTWTIDNVQLEAGASATDFERRPYGTELALCQRYYCKSYAVNVAPATSSVEGYATNGGLAGGTANSRSSHRFQVEMRASPTMAYWDYVGNASRESSHNSANTRTDNVASGSFSLTPSSSGFGFNDASGSGQAGAGAWWSLVHWTASAEL